VNLIIDAGNTLIKYAVFDNFNIIFYDYNSEFTEAHYLIIKKKFPAINQIIFSNVGHHQLKFLNILPDIKIIEFSSHTPIPIINLYQSPETLGMDRLAAVIGANQLYPKENIMVIDLGSAITYDFINNNSEYLGGNISPGLEMRFKALNNFTSKLPLLTPNENFNPIGKNTNEAILTGVEQGLVFEISSYIDYFSQYFTDLKVLLTGGNCFFFEKILKNHIFVNPNLLLIGLNKILEYNLGFKI